MRGPTSRCWEGCQYLCLLATRDSPGDQDRKGFQGIGGSDLTGHPLRTGSHRLAGTPTLQTPTSQSPGTGEGSVSTFMCLALGKPVEILARRCGEESNAMFLGRPARGLGQETPRGRHAGLHKGAEKSRQHWRRRQMSEFSGFSWCSRTESPPSETPAAGKPSSVRLRLCVCHLAHIWITATLAARPSFGESSSPLGGPRPYSRTATPIPQVHETNLSRPGLDCHRGSTVGRMRAWSCPDTESTSRRESTSTMEHLAAVEREIHSHSHSFHFSLPDTI